MASVAIIVPFRIQKGQNREWELEEFTSYMTKYMNTLMYDDRIVKYHIYIIEQDYGKKFNRGMLLNIGFHLSNELYDTFIFHDVDLLPNNKLQNYYSRKPEYKKIYQSKPNDVTIVRRKGPYHIGASWKDRYKDDSYLGGIISFNKEMFEEINGFPNIFWGWGGEDDAMRERCILNDIIPRKIRPNGGKIIDIEQDNFGNKMNLEEKLQFLKNNRNWKCNDKWECRERDKNNWKNDGYNTINSCYKIKEWETRGDYSKIKVII